MRLRTFAFLLLPVVAAAPARAATIFLKIKAETGGQPTRLTVRALSRVDVNLSPEPVVYVDEGQGFKAREDLQCRLANTERGLRLEADREFTGSCELPLTPSPRLRVRLGYKDRGTLSTSNTLTLVQAGTATAQTGQ